MNTLAFLLGALVMGLALLLGAGSGWALFWILDLVFA